MKNGTTRVGIAMGAVIALALVSPVRAATTPRTAAATVHSAAADHTLHARHHRRHLHHRSRPIAPVLSQAHSETAHAALPARPRPHRGRTHGTVPSLQTHSRAPKSHAERTLTPFDRAALLEMPERALLPRTNFELESWMKALESGRGPPRGSPITTPPLGATPRAVAHAPAPRPVSPAPTSAPLPTLASTPALPPPTRNAVRTLAALPSFSTDVVRPGPASRRPRVRRPEGAATCLSMPSIGGLTCPASSSSPRWPRSHSS